MHFEKGLQRVIVDGGGADIETAQLHTRVIGDERREGTERQRRVKGQIVKLLKERISKQNELVWRAKRVWQSIRTNKRGWEDMGADTNPIGRLELRIQLHGIRAARQRNEGSVNPPQAKRLEVSQTIKNRLTPVAHNELLRLRLPQIFVDLSFSPLLRGSKPQALDHMGAVLAAPVQAFGYIGVERPAFKLERDAGDYQIRDYPALLAAEVDATADKCVLRYFDSFGSPPNSNGAFQTFMSCPCCFRSYDALTLGSFYLLVSSPAILINISPVHSFVYSSLVYSNGFRSLAGYIFGGNVSAETGSSQSIAMTAPVHTEITGDVIESNGTSGGMKMAFFLPSQYTSIEQLPRPKDDRVRLVQVPAKRYAVVTFNGSFVHNDPAVRCSHFHDSFLSIRFY
jgi:hypothetical protein